MLPTPSNPMQPHRPAPISSSPSPSPSPSPFIPLRTIQKPPSTSTSTPVAAAAAGHRPTPATIGDRRTARTHARSSSVSFAEPNAGTSAASTAPSLAAAPQHRLKATAAPPAAPAFAFSGARRRVSLSTSASTSAASSTFASPATSASSSLSSPLPYPRAYPVPDAHHRARTAAASLSSSSSSSRPARSSPPPPRTRSRTMSFSSRGLRSLSLMAPPSSKPPASRLRTALFVALVLASLFLVGTVVVLSTVSYYLAIPSWAYLTEAEVPWRPHDVIGPALASQADTRARASRRGALDVADFVTRAAPRRRQEWEELADEDEAAAAAQAVGAAQVDTGVLGADELAQVWDELATPTGAAGLASATAAAAASPDADADAYLPDEYADEAEYADTLEESASAGSSPATPGAQASGSGTTADGAAAYWRAPGWAGTVAGTASWDRLYNVTARAGERIPRLIHQTWKTDTLPEKWRDAWVDCREGMPDYEYMLWTDETSREFIATHYPSQLQMYDTYPFPIQRADSIRYFVLHHFGGVYMDLDIGCRRRLDPLLQGDWDVILPITKPVGVSNDLIFSAKGAAFMDDTVHGLSAFNHHYGSNYPTVMFSTGPMFLSAQYAIYSSAHPLTPTHPRAAVRILPKSLYGKNAPAGAVPHSFFSHFYGSSWHADDAGFITFLGKWGKKLMVVGAAVVVLAAARLVWLRAKHGGAYSQLPTTAHGGGPSPTSLAAFLGPLSPSSDGSAGGASQTSEFGNALRRAGHLILAAPATLLPGGGGGSTASPRRQRGWLYFVPASLQPSNGGSGGGARRPKRSRTASEASQLPLRRPRGAAGGAYGMGTLGGDGSGAGAAPPPYERVSSDRLGRTGSPALGAAAGAYPQPHGRAADGMDEVDAFLKSEALVEEPEEVGDEAGDDADASEDADDDADDKWAAWQRD